MVFLVGKEPDLLAAVKSYYFEVTIIIFVHNKYSKVIIDRWTVKGIIVKVSQNKATEFKVSKINIFIKNCKSKINMKLYLFTDIVQKVTL